MRIRTAGELGLKVRERRRELGWSQDELARRVGVGRKRIISIESGARRTELAPVLAILAELGLNVDLKMGSDSASRQLSDRELAQRPGGSATVDRYTVDLDEILANTANETYE